VSTLAICLSIAAVPLGPSSAAAAALTGTLLGPGAADSAGPGTYVSDKSDGTASAYHFVVETASGGRVSIAGVDVQVEAAGSPTWTTVGAATQIGATDTWQLNWAQSESGPTNGDGEVRAVLRGSDGSTGYIPSESGRLVHFDTSRPTAEVTVPTEGGQLGFSGGTAAISGTASSDVSSVDAFYTTSAPGTDPTWTSCGNTSGFTTGPGDGQSFSVGCTLSGGDAASNVTAVAVAPSSGVSFIPFLHTQGAGDAQRVIQQRIVRAPSLAPTHLTLLPKGVHRAIETQQTFTAHVVNGAGDPLPGIHVHFSADGENRASGWATTGRGGNATIRYEGRRLGTDTVTATVGATHDRSTITWTKAPTFLSIEKHPAGTTAPGQQVSGYGHLSSTARSCVGGKTIVLKASDGRVVAKTRTRPRGGYSFSGRPRRSVSVYVVFRGTAMCAGSRSENLAVVVR